jgi:hypothetical protein
MTLSAWHKQRLAELKAAAPAKRKKAKLFAVLELEAAAAAFAAMDCQKATLWIWLVHKARMTGRNTVAVPNAAVAKLGVSREVKRRALLQLERAGLIAVERSIRKTPTVSLICLSTIVDRTVYD